MNVVAEMLLTDRSSLTVWATLMLAAAFSVALLARADGGPHPHLALLESVSLRARRARRQREAEQSVRFAGELQVAAERAAHAADRWQAHWQRTRHEASAAWQRWQAAEQRLAMGRRAAAYAMPDARTPADYRDRESFLIRAVAAAEARGDLPAGSLATHRWNPWLHPVHQELAVRHAIAGHHRRAYLRSQAAERTAHHDAQLARSARDSLHQESVLATIQADAVRHLTFHDASPARLALAPAGG